MEDAINSNKLTVTISCGVIGLGDYYYAVEVIFLNHYALQHFVEICDCTNKKKLPYALFHRGRLQKCLL